MVNIADGATIDIIESEIRSYQQANSLPEDFTERIMKDFMRFGKPGYVVVTQNGDTGFVSCRSTRQGAEEELGRSRPGDVKVLIQFDEAEWDRYTRVQTYLAVRRIDIFVQAMFQEIKNRF